MMTRYRLAFLYDRLAAFIVDFTVVYFLHSFLSFVCKREQNTAMIEGFQTAFIFWIIVNVLLFFVIYFAYHYIGFLRFNTTIGKYTFKIQLKNIWGLETISNSQALKYSAWKTLGLLSFGLTYVGAFTDDKRRTLHEKMSDTIIVTKKQKFSLTPTLRERQFFTGLLLPTYCLLFFALLFGLVIMYQSAQKEILEAKLDTSLLPKCEWVEQEYKDSSMGNRMEFAISLFLLSEIENNCLEREARAAFETGKDLEEANMAFALLYPEQRQEYLTEACNVAPGGFACFDSTEAKALHRKPYQILWQAADAHNASQFETSLSLLNQLKDSYFQPLLGYLKFKNLWKLKPTEMSASLSQFSDLIEPDTFDKVIAWACLDSVDTNCERAPSFCSQILNKTDFSRAGLEEELSYVRLRECKNKWGEELPEEISEEAANLYYAKYRLKTHNDVRVLRDLLVGTSNDLIQKEIAKTMFRHGDLNTEDQKLLSRFKTSTDNRQPASE